MDYNHTMAPYNPTARKEAWQAFEQALWTVFGYFLARADRFSVYYHPDDPAVAPLLALGFAPRKPDMAYAPLELTGALTDELRRLLWGPGAGKFTWYAVTICRGKQQLCNIVEHERMAMLAAEPDDLAALTAAGVNPRCIRPWSRIPGPPAPWSVGMHRLGEAVAGAAGVSDYSIRPVVAPAEDWSAFWVRWGDSPYSGVHLECPDAILATLQTSEAAAAAVATLGAPPQAGDSLRLEPTGGLIQLPPRPRWHRFRPTHSCVRPTRAEWLAALRLAGARADRFAVAWRDEPPEANGWVCSYGLERLRPFCDREGSSDWLPFTREGEGDLTPAVLSLLLDEPPTGIPDLAHGNLWQAGDEPPAPWWQLELIGEGRILLRSTDNGQRLDLDLTDAEAAVLDVPPGRLSDQANAFRRRATLDRLKAQIRHRLELPGADTDLIEIDKSHASGLRWEMQRRDGTLLVTLTVTVAAIRHLALLPRPDEVLLAMRAGRHLLVEWDGTDVCCRALPAPPPFP